MAVEDLRFITTVAIRTPGDERRVSSRMAMNRTRHMAWIMPTVLPMALLALQRRQETQVGAALPRHLGKLPEPDIDFAHVAGSAHRVHGGHGLEKSALGFDFSQP